MEAEGARRLAAILVADVVGYSWLMGTDEESTHARLRSHRVELIEPTISAHHGRIVKLTGDGFLAEFASVVDATVCGIDIQREMVRRDADLPDDQRMRLRIGINLGDVIVEENDIYGDGVNVAARLEGLAEPNGICISDMAHQMIRSRPDLSFADGGEQRLKNITQPIRVWRWMEGREATGHTAVQTDKSSDPAERDKPSVAVLPFDNMSRDPDQEYFSDGITEDLITDLSRLSGLLVIARNSVFRYKGRPTKPQDVAVELGVRYVLEGSIRRAENHIRINAQLIDATTGYHVWAERYDRELVNIFALQDDITREIVSALEVRLTEPEQDRLARRYTENLEAFDLFLRAKERQLRRTQEGLREARELLENAIQLDASFAGAHAVLADNYRQEWTFGWRRDEGMLDEALKLATKAISLDATLPLAHSLLGWIYLWHKKHDEAEKEAQLAVQLDPNFAEGYARLGHIVALAGRPEEGIGLIRKALRLDPHSPFLYSFFLGHALASLRRDQEAVDALRRALSRNPEHIGSRQYLAASLWHLEYLDEAKAEAEALLRVDPDFSVNAIASRIPEKRQQMLDRHVAALRALQLPD